VLVGLKSIIIIIIIIITTAEENYEDLRRRGQDG